MQESKLPKKEAKTKDSMSTGTYEVELTESKPSGKSSLLEIEDEDTAMGNYVSLKYIASLPVMHLIVFFLPLNVKAEVFMLSCCCFFTDKTVPYDSDEHHL